MKKKKIFLIFSCFMMAFVTTINNAVAYKVKNVEKNGIIIADAYIMERKSTAVGAFLTIVNTKNTNDALINIKEDKTIAERIEIHITKVQNGVAKMEKVSEIVIVGNQTIVMKPGGYHIMFMGLKEPVKHPDLHTITLQFKNAGDIMVELPVKRRSLIRVERFKRTQSEDTDIHGITRQERY